MLIRELIMLTIEKIYAAGVKGDKQALTLYNAPNATYRISGEDVFDALIPPGPSHLDETVGYLRDLIQPREARIVEAVVEGNKAAVQMEVEISVRGGEPVAIEIMDLWEFDEDGQVQSLVQFMDTILVKRLVAGMAA